MIYKHKCVICGKDFESKSPKRQFCSNNCRMYLPNEYITCKYCGKTTFKRRTGNHEFCSLDCRNRYKTIKTYKETRYCLNCGKEMIVYPHQISRNKGKYCSAECQFKHCNSGTDIEMIVMKYLDEHNIDYEFQYNLDDMFRPDFYLTKYNIILEVQGDYWHGNPKLYNESNLDERQIKHKIRDNRKFGYYKHKGIKFYELWGLDIKKILIKL